MNYFRVQGALFAGMQVLPVEVECAQSRRLPYLQILGCGGSAAGELRERVLAALGTLQGGKFRLPARRFTVRVQPAVAACSPESLDLAVALALLGSVGLIPPERVAGVLACGRLGLDGALGGGARPAAFRRALRESGADTALLPWDGSEALSEGQLRRGGGFGSLAEVLAFLRDGRSAGRCRTVESETQAPPPGQIWSRLGGQEVAKRVLEISAAGAHHLLLPGPHAARADLLAHALSTLLPPLGAREAEEVREIYALAGMRHVLPSRPFHAWGARPALPSLLTDRRARSVEEALLAHRGVLFVDQVCERERELFPALLHPMLHGTLPARLHDRRAEMPAEVLLVAATPTCACGFRGDPRFACACRPTEAKRFEARWRRLLRYPFDLCLCLSAERAAEPTESDGLALARAERVDAARRRMENRQGRSNARLGEEGLFTGVSWGSKASRMWGALESRAPGDRASFLALARVALTICDLRAGQELSENDLLEALHYFPGSAGADSVAGGRAARQSVPEVNSMAIP